MSSAIVATTVILGTLYLCCAIAVAWSVYTAAPGLARILRFSGLFWGIWLTICFAILTYLTANCAGNVLYGFHDCARLTTPQARAASGVAGLSFLGGIAYGVVLLIGGGIWEALARTRAPDA